MKNYEKPVALANSELAEGVFMASGADSSTDCWTIDVVNSQDWNGSHHIFEIRCSHSTSVVHISSMTAANLTFSDNVTDAYSEFPCEFSGKTVIVKRELHANAYNSGDTMTYKVWVKAADEASTKAITCIGATITCTHQPNVQGGYD